MCTKLRAQCRNENILLLLLSRPEPRYAYWSVCGSCLVFEWRDIVVTGQTGILTTLTIPHHTFSLSLSSGPSHYLALITAGGKISGGEYSSIWRWLSQGRVEPGWWLGTSLSCISQWQIEPCPSIYWEDCQCLALQLKQHSHPNTVERNFLNVKIFLFSVAACLTFTQTTPAISSSKPIKSINWFEWILASAEVVRMRAEPDYSYPRVCLTRSSGLLRSVFPLATQLHLLQKLIKSCFLSLAHTISPFLNITKISDKARNERTGIKDCRH